MRKIRPFVVMVGWRSRVVSAANFPLQIKADVGRSTTLTQSRMSGHQQNKSKRKLRILSQEVAKAFTPSSNSTRVTKYIL